MREETRRKTIEMFRLADRRGCRHQALVRYFDEQMEACGASCDFCRGESIDTLVAGAGRHFARATPRVALGDLMAAPPAAGDRARFERLRATRKRLADAEGVPAYIVFSDAVLRQLAERVPRTRSELLLISGIGPVKAERYGEAFLEALREG